MAKISASQATGTTLTQKVTVAGDEYLTVIAVAGPTASAAGDIAVNVQPYLDDNDTTIAPLNLAALDSVAAVLASNKAWIMARYRVAGFQAVQLQAKNNNAGTLPVEVDFFTG